MTMTKQEQNLKQLRRSIYILREDLNKVRNTFKKETEQTDFGDFYNDKVGKIRMELNMGYELSELIDGLSSEIKRLEYEKKGGEKWNAK